MVIKATVIHLLAFLLLVLEGCRTLPNSETRYVLTGRLAAIVDSFTTVNKDRPVYELFIDKDSPISANIFLYGGPATLIKDENTETPQTPIFSITSNGYIVDVFSGAERYIRKISANTSDLKPKLSGMDDTEILWIVRDEDGVMTVKEEDVAQYPFVPLPKPYRVQFVPPVVPVDSTE